MEMDHQEVVLHMLQVVVPIDFRMRGLDKVYQR